MRNLTLVAVTLFSVAASVAACGAQSAGGQCTADSDCSSGFTCLTSGSSPYADGGVYPSTCTKACTQDSDCAFLDGTDVGILGDDTTVGTCMACVGADCQTANICGVAHTNSQSL
jgi:hypothetical protein